MFCLYIYTPLNPPPSARLIHRSCQRINLTYQHMMFDDGSYQLPKKIPQIKRDEKFLSRLLSRESSLANPSHRVYYGVVSSSVPFVWESQPGTPKHTFSETTLPPLTPPPSYYSNISNRPIATKRSRTNLFRALFPKINLTKYFVSSSTSSLPSSSSPWASSDSRIVPMAAVGRNHRQRRPCSISSCSSLDFIYDMDEQHTMSSRTSTLCFGIRRSSSTSQAACKSRTWS